MKHNDFDLLTDPIPRLLRRLAVPVGTGLFFNTMFNVVDTFYGGLISTQALAALSLAFPVFFLIIAVGAGISMGSAALLGHALGSGRREEAELYAAQAISFGIVHGLLLAVAGSVAAPILFKLLGATGEYQAMTVRYMRTLFCGTVFFVVNHVLNAILSATGDTRSFRNFLIGGFFLNLLLDPWLMYGWLGVPALGLAGIGWATVAIHLLGNAYLLTRAARTGLLSRHSWAQLLPRAEPFRRIAGQGFPASLNMLTVAVGIFVIIWYVGRFGKEAVAAFGIATRIEQIALLPAMGLNMATLTLVAQNFGARFPERVRQTVRTAMTAGTAIMAFGTPVIFLAAGPLMGLFSKDPTVVEVGTVYLRIEVFVFVAYVVIYVNNSALQGLQKPFFALWIGLLRQIAGPLLVFHLLAYRLGWGLLGIWWGIFLITWLAAGVSIYYTRRVVLTLCREAEAVLPSLDPNAV